MAEHYRFKVSKGVGNARLATCKKYRVRLEAEDEKDLWKQIQEKFSVNKHFRRKGYWTCTELSGAVKEVKD